MKFHFLVSFRLPDAQIAESHAGQLGRALHHVLAGACSDVCAHWPVPPGPADPASLVEWAVETVPSGTVVPVLRRPSESESWTLSDFTRWLAKRPLHLVVLLFAWFLCGFTLGHMAAKWL